MLHSYNQLTKDQRQAEGIKITNSIVLIHEDRFYNPVDSNGNPINIITADSGMLANHWRHNCTNYDYVMDIINEKFKRPISKFESHCISKGVLNVVSYKLNKDRLLHADKVAELTKDLKVQTQYGQDQYEKNKKLVKDLKKSENSRKQLNSYNRRYRSVISLAKQYNLNYPDLPQEYRTNMNRILRANGRNQILDIGEIILGSVEKATDFLKRIYDSKDQL